MAPHYGDARVSHNNLNDMEHRFTRGRSEERYPHYFRGRSASPVNTRPARSWSAEPELYALSGREGSPPSDVCYRRSLSPAPSFELAKPYADNYYHDRTATSPHYYYRPHSYTFCRPYHYYTRPQYPLYNYYRPHTRTTAEGLRAMLAIADINANRFGTPTRRTYLNYDEAYPLTSPLYRTSYTHRSVNDHLYLPQKHRPHYEYPNLKYVPNHFPSLAKKYPSILYPSMYQRP